MPPIRFGWPELLVVLVIVVLIFGVGRITKVASELGKGIREFRKGLNNDNDQADQENQEK